MQTTQGTQGLTSPTSNPPVSVKQLNPNYAILINLTTKDGVTKLIECSGEV